MGQTGVDRKMEHQNDRAPRHDIDPRLSNLRNALDELTGADADLDRLLAEVLGAECDDFSGDATSSRKLVEQVLPNSRLQVGYDVSGVLPNAVLHYSGERFSIVAPTVPLAVLRALIEALITHERR